jgi:RNA polymerase sigma-B factor
VIARAGAEDGHVRRGVERELFARLAAGDGTARETLIKRFLPLARSLARNYGARDDRDDLEQVAAIGLVKAANRFDPGRGLAFSTYAVPLILGELRRHLRDRVWSVRVPRSLQELAVRVDRVSRELSGELGRSPTLVELADRVGATSELVREAQRVGQARHPVSLDLPREPAGDARGSPREVAVEEPGYARVEDAALCEDLLRLLPDRDRRILELRFREDRVQAQIADAVGLSQMQVSRAIRTSVERLRRAAAACDDGAVIDRGGAG